MQQSKCLFSISSDIHHRSTVQGTWYCLLRHNLYTNWFYFPTEMAIPQFMTNFRATFPSCSKIAPHGGPSNPMDKGMACQVWPPIGEQGAESVHARFNTLQRTYHSMQDKVQQVILNYEGTTYASYNVAAIPQ